MTLVTQTLTGYTVITLLFATALWLGVKSVRLQRLRRALDDLLYNQQVMTAATFTRLRRTRLIKRPVVTYLTYPGAYLIHNRKTGVMTGATSDNILHDLYTATRTMTPDTQHETDVYAIAHMAIQKRRLQDPVAFLEGIANTHQTQNQT